MASVRVMGHRVHPRRKGYRLEYKRDKKRADRFNKAGRSKLQKKFDKLLHEYVIEGDRLWGVAKLFGSLQREAQKPSSPFYGLVNKEGLKDKRGKNLGLRKEERYDVISRKVLQDWLDRQEEFVVHKRAFRDKNIQARAPQNPFATIQIDLTDMANVSTAGNYRYVLVATDLFTKKLWMRAMTNKSGKTTALHMKSILDEMKAKPHTIQSDNGAEFIASEMKALLKARKVRQVFSYAYSPQSQGQVESTNRVIKRFLSVMAAKVGKRDQWRHHLATMAKNYNDSYNTTIREIPDEVEEAYLKSGPNAVLVERVRVRLQRRKSKKFRGGDKVGKFKVGDKVRVRLGGGQGRKKRGVRGVKLNWSVNPFVVRKVMTIGRDRPGLPRLAYRLSVDGSPALLKSRFGQSDLLAYVKPDRVTKTKEYSEEVLKFLEAMEAEQAEELRRLKAMRPSSTARRSDKATRIGEVERRREVLAATTRVLRRRGPLRPAAAAAALKAKRAGGSS